MADRPQSFASHARMVPGFHYVTGLFAIVYLAWSVWRAVTLRDVESHFDMIGAFALTGVYWYARVFPLKAQDRVIRLEEQLRMTRLLPAPLAERAATLSTRQLIALRFASDQELAELVEWVLAGSVTDAKAIKQRIRSWRPDHQRV
jgi:hypothetical protein